MNVVIKSGRNHQMLASLLRPPPPFSFRFSGLHSSPTLNCLVTSSTAVFSNRNSDRTSPPIRHFSSGLLSTFSEAKPVLVVQDILIRVHDVSGLPWWAVIVITTCLARTAITLPLTVYQNNILARYANLRPEIDVLAKQLSFETAFAVKKFGWSQRQAKHAFNRSMRKIIRGLVIRDNCHPMKASILLWFQIPLWIGISFALRNLVSMLPERDLGAHMVFLALSSQGFLWIPNLTIPDASLILPVTLGLTNLLITQIHSLRTLKMTRFQKSITCILYVASVASVPIAAYVPSCLCLYWTTSSLFGLFQNLLFMSPKFRRIFRIQDNVTGAHNHSLTPYTDLLNEFRKRFKWYGDK